MFTRTSMVWLERWAKKPERKPLVLRGARQVGKTTLVQTFGKQFDVFIDLNCEIFANRKLFEQKLSIDRLIDLIFLHKNIVRSSNQRVLIFIDEIQSSPEAVAILRYFYEDFPEIYVISAGSFFI